jgi:hypothetical protein
MTLLSERTIEQIAGAVLFTPRTDNDSAENLSEMAMHASDAALLRRVAPESEYFGLQVERLTQTTIHELHTGEIVLPSVDGLSDAQVVAEVAATVVERLLTDQPEQSKVENALFTRNALLSARNTELEIQTGEMIAMYPESAELARALDEANATIKDQERQIITDRELRRLQQREIQELRRADILVARTLNRVRERGGAVVKQIVNLVK